MIFKKETYDLLKWIAQIVLPGLGTLYFVVGGIWHFPYPQEVVGTVMAIDAFLGLILGISTANFNADEAKKTVLEIDNQPK